MSVNRLDTVSRCTILPLGGARGIYHVIAEAILCLLLILQALRNMKLRKTIREKNEYEARLRSLIR